MDVSDVAVVLCSDDQYAMPLAVTLASLDRNLPAGVQVHVFTWNMRAESWRRVQSSTSAELIRHEVSELPSTLHASEHVSQATYLRLLIPDLLPETTTRVLYLDSDLLICRDVAELLATDMCAHPIAAAVDQAVLAVGSPLGIRGWQDLDLEPSAPYFNAGVLLMDLDGWRNEALGQRVLDFAVQQGTHLRFWDQCALNAVFSGRWHCFDSCWNAQITDVDKSSAWMYARFDGSEVEALFDHPGILHYTGPMKPWRARYDGLYAKEWLEALDRTAWSGWRPKNRPIVGFSKRVVRKVGWEILQLGQE
jgi:lipopolysaccharide biosynthesis glycosyltransferase